MGRRRSLKKQIEEAFESIHVQGASRHEAKSVGIDREYTFSEETNRTYVDCCKAFYERIPCIMRPRKIRDTTVNLVRYGVCLMHDNDCSDAYIETTLSALRKMIEGWRALGWAGIRPEDLVPYELNFGLRRSAPRLAYSREDAQRIIDAVAADPHDGAAFKRALELMRSSGLRRNELCYLREDDLNRQTGVITVRSTTAKGGRERVITSDAVGQELLQAVVAQLPQGPGYIFRDTRRFGKRLEEAIARACKELAINCLGMHGFRSLFASDYVDRLMAAGMTELEARRLLTALLGHNRIEVTYRYVAKKGKK